MSSSGFEIDDNVPIPDYDLALNSKLGQGQWTGRLSTGEKVMSLTTVLINTEGQKSGAVRYLISLEDVDNQLFIIISVIFTSCLAAISLVVFSGMFFIRSIIRPIRNISRTAKAIAAGDLDAQIEDYLYEDEIGELCQTINHMRPNCGSRKILKMTLSLQYRMN